MRVLDFPKLVTFGRSPNNNISAFIRVNIKTFER